MKSKKYINIILMSLVITIETISSSQHTEFEIGQDRQKDYTLDSSNKFDIRDPSLNIFSLIPGEFVRLTQNKNLSEIFTSLYKIIPPKKCFE
jgi:hypothetical protein